MSEAAATPPPGEPGASAPGFPAGANQNPGTDALGSPTPRRRRRHGLLPAAPVVVLACVGVWFAFPRGPSDDLGRMQGDWAVKGADGRERAVVRIDGDRWTYHAGGQPRGTSRIALNPAATPKEIDLTALEPDGRPKTFTRGTVGAEMKEVGVYALAGDELRVAKAPAWNGGTRPTSLDDPDGPPALTLVRVSK